MPCRRRRRSPTSTHEHAARLFEHPPTRVGRPRGRLLRDQGLDPHRGRDQGVARLVGAVGGVAAGWPRAQRLARAAQPSSRREPRGRRDRERRPAPRDGVRGRGVGDRSVQAAGRTVVGRRGDADRQPHRRCTRGGPCGRHPSPRHQAAEPAHHQVRQREGVRLRHRGPHRDRAVPAADQFDHLPVREPGADRRVGGGCSVGCVLVGPLAGATPRRSRLDQGGAGRERCDGDGGAAERSGPAGESASRGGDRSVPATRAGRPPRCRVVARRVR